MDSHDWALIIAIIGIGNLILWLIIYSAVRTALTMDRQQKAHERRQSGAIGRW